MKVEKIRIKNYRSIKDIEITMPKNKPLVVFGPNNAGKSNILSAIDRLLGERYPPNYEVLDSDYFMRDKDLNPTIEILADFNMPYYTDRYDHQYSKIGVTYGFNGEDGINLLHDGSYNRLYMNQKDREVLQSFLLDATRNASFHFNYSNKYSILSKFNKSLHDSLTETERKNLRDSFKDIKDTFESKNEFKNLFSKFKEALNQSVQGFVHYLEVDFSAYDPNNYANALRILALENEDVRAFEEFGTGEQQILLMAFVKSYMEAFKGSNFLLILEEPEINLHPLAQKWLKKYIYEICESGVQVIISTHSPNFIDASNLHGLVRVFKRDGVTNIVQTDEERLFELLIETRVPKNLIQIKTVGEYFDTRLYTEQLEGMFSEKIILVEGLTEKLSLPIWLDRAGYNLAKNGVEIINCMGKNNIPMIYRIYKLFGYECICVFDGDFNKQNEKDRGNQLLGAILQDFQDITPENDVEYGENFVCFAHDFEWTLSQQLKNYEELVNKAKELSITNKQGIAKYVAQNSDSIPDLIYSLIALLRGEAGAVAEHYSEYGNELSKVGL